MYDRISRTFTDYCPFCGRERTIEIEYTVAVDREHKKVSFKKDFFRCVDGDDCPFPNGCPLYLTAPDDPF